MKIVTFDFDGTLTKKNVQKYATKLINNGIDVWVITSRYCELTKHLYPNNPTLDDLWNVIDTLKIPRYKVIFTRMLPKADILENTKVMWHLDDDSFEIDEINERCKTIGINVALNSKWKTKCNQILNELNPIIENNKKT